jgi:hypothetical protein
VDGRVVSSDVVRVFVGFSRIFLLGILIFKRLNARRVYKSFGVKGLKRYIVAFVQGRFCNYTRENEKPRNTAARKPDFVALA